MDEMKQFSLPAKLWLLFFTFAKIAALVVGGGLAMLPVIEETFVNKKKLLTREEMLDMITVTQMVPGIIAANSAVFIGMKIAGFIGALAALTGAIFPSFIVILIIAYFFPGLSPDNKYLLGAFAGVRAGVTGLIAVTALKLAVKTVKGRFEAIAGAVLLVMAFFIHPALVIICGMAAGVFYTALIRKRLDSAKENK